MWPINYKIIEIYNKVSRQVIPSMSGSIAINELAVMNRIQLSDIEKEDYGQTLDYISMISSIVINLRNKKAAEKRGKNG